MNKIKFRLQNYFDNPKYLYLLLALVLLLVNGAIALKFESFSWLMDISYGLIVFLGPFYASSNYSSFIKHALLGVTIYIFHQVNMQDSMLGSVVNSVLTFLFFYLLLHKVIVNVWKEKVISFNILLSVICGYLILGIMCGFLFKSVDSIFPDSFNIKGSADYFEFIYFSFITLTSIGYGDIVPVDAISKMTAILLSISGQIYITVVMALIVGKYIVYHSDHIR